MLPEKQTQEIHIEVKVSKSMKDFLDNCKIILENKLHLARGGTICPDCKYYLKHYNEDDFLGTYKWSAKGVAYKRPNLIAAIAYCEGKAVGALLINFFYTNFYVKKEFRKKGIAKKLFKETRNVHDLSRKVLNTGTSKAAKTLKESLGLPSLIKEMVSLDKKKN